MGPQSKPNLQAIMTGAQQPREKTYEYILKSSKPATSRNKTYSGMDDRKCTDTLTGIRETFRHSPIAALKVGNRWINNQQDIEDFLYPAVANDRRRLALDI